MKSPALTGLALVLIFALIPSFSQAFSTSRSLGQNLQFQLLSHPNAADDAKSIHGDRDGRIASRRRELLRAMVPSALTFLGPLTASAATTTNNISGAEKFCGTYSDPINHPGGTRTISLIGSDDVVGDYRLAQVVGGGGIGEPKEFVLPAVVVGDRAIIIDFSPKGGPRDFTGVLENDGSIKFIRDGNRWPRLK
ncbi:hypothetical protein ACHAWU_005709 [Discostella pseudostelligera]|uniref:Uncharacterized protein n=1 Tax=Discostella pseudostelligera TaxID=259834 RepID=A0ABD3MRL5_9STRA